MDTEMRYSTKLAPEQLLQDVDAFWAELGQPDSTARKIVEDEGIGADEGIDMAALSAVRRDEVIKVDRGSGFAGAELIVHLAPYAPILAPILGKVAEKVIMDLWGVAFKRWIERRRGGDAIVEKKEKK